MGNRFGAHLKFLGFICALIPQFAEAQLIPQRGDTLIKLSTKARHPRGGTLVQELSIGSETAGPNYQFNDISDILAAKDGSTWICEWDGSLTSRCRRYGGSGAFIGIVTQLGEGPGELEAPIGIAQMPDGRVLIRDIRARIHVFAPEGRHLQTWMYPELNIARFDPSIAADSGGIIYLTTVLADRLADTAAADRAVTIRLWGDGKVIDTIANPRLPDARLPRPWSLQQGGGGMGFRATLPAPGQPNMRRLYHDVPYSPSNIWHWNPFGQLVTVVTSRYALDVRIPRPAGVFAHDERKHPAPVWRQGDPVTSIRRKIDAVPMSGAERADRLRTLNMLIERFAVDHKVGDPVQFPRTKPFIDDFQFGNDGRIWVRVFGPSERVAIDRKVAAWFQSGWRDTFAYDVFEHDGALVGRVQLPDNFSLRAMSGDIIWGVSTDNDEVETVKRFRVVWR